MEAHLESVRESIAVGVRPGAHGHDRCPHRVPSGPPVASCDFQTAIHVPMRSVARPGSESVEVSIRALVCKGVGLVQVKPSSTERTTTRSESRAQAGGVWIFRAPDGPATRHRPQQRYAARRRFPESRSARRRGAARGALQVAPPSMERAKRMSESSPSPSAGSSDRQTAIQVPVASPARLGCVSCPMSAAASVLRGTATLQVPPLSRERETKMSSSTPAASSATHAVSQTPAPSVAVVGSRSSPASIASGADHVAPESKELAVRMSTSPCCCRSARPTTRSRPRRRSHP